MKIIAMYLPQFHEIPENDEWWGKGFTEWTNVKKAKPIFEGHNQPRVPLNKNYYNLLDDNVKIWQANLAKKYGVYGFCYYHYWFSGKLLLEKPMEQMLKNPEIDLPFCIAWANEQWSKQWVGENKILLPQLYGDREEWIAHFNYLLQFFKDERYIKQNNRPFFIINNPQKIDVLDEMLDCWTEQAKKNGFDGIDFGYYVNWKAMAGKSVDDSRFTYDIQGQPHYALMKYNQGASTTILRKIINRANNFIERKMGINLKQMSPVKLVTKRIDYDKMWELVLQQMPDSSRSIPGSFVDWDNTPRYGEMARVYIGANPEKFKKYLSIQIKRAREIYHSDFLFMFAWNEWCEGGYLEPDELYGYGYLEAIRDALQENNEFEQ